MKKPKLNTYDIWISSQTDERVEDRHQNYSIDGIQAPDKETAIKLGVAEFKKRHGEHKHIENAEAYKH